MATKYDEEYFVDDEDICNAFSQFRKLDRKKKGVSCPNCGGEKNCMEEGNLICRDCGAFVREELLIDDSPEWNNNDDKNVSRCNFNINPLLPRASMSTVVIGNRSLPRPLQKMHKWNTYSYRETSLFKVFIKIQGICQENGINWAVINDANRIYTTISEKQIRRGDSRLGMVGACIYYGCRKRGVCKTEEEIAQMLNIGVDRITKAYGTLTKFMFDSGKAGDSEMSSPDVLNYAQQLSEKLRVKSEYMGRIRELAGYVQENMANLRNMPISLATGVIYFVFVESRGGKGDIGYKRKIAKSAGLSDITVGKAYNGILSLKK